MAVRIQMRRGTSSEWNDADPILNEGEIGYNTTLGQIKVGDGASLWSELTYLATETELNTSLEGYVALSEKGAIDGVAELDANKNVLTGSSVIFEGATTDSYQLTIVATDPTADRTITFPDASGTLVISSDYGSGIGTWLATPSSANLASAMTDETGSGLLVFNTSPSIETSLTTATTSFDLLNTAATTVNFAGAATVLSIGATSGTTTFNNSVTISGDLTVNGTTTTIDTQHLQVEDKNIVLAYGSTSDVAADGGGITLVGTTDKTFTWVDSTDAWTSSEHMNLVAGKSYKIDNTAITAALPGLTWG